MLKKLSWVLFGLICLSACSVANDLLDVSRSYQQRRDYASLHVIADQLSKGMSQQKVESLLGPPDYSPTSGVFLYSSDRREFSKDAGRELPVGLILEFRVSGKTTDSLQSWSLGVIGE